MYSMTGFGRGDASWQGRGVRCELKSVNHRGLDVRVRIDRELAAFEGRAHAALRKALARGRVDALLVFERAADARGTLVFDEAMADRLVDRLHEFARRRGDLGKHVELGQLLARDELFLVQQDVEEEQRLGELVDIALAIALEDLRGSRAAEGTELEHDLTARLTEIERIVKEVATRTADAPQRARTRLEERLAASGAKDAVDPDRLAQEVALLADRADVAEELTRLVLHVQRFRELAGEDGAIGRKLDFLCQELNREANTVASKCSDAETAHLVVDLKTEIERIREQVQNLE